MKKFALLFALPVLLNAAASAAEEPAVGFVDLRKVLVESKVGKKNKAEIDKLVKEKQSTLAKEESKLQALQQSLQKEQLLLTDAQKKEKQKELLEKAETYQKMVNEAKQAVARKDTEYSTKTLTEVRDIVATLAKEMKLGMVFEVSESGLLYAEDSVDLTKKVIEKYDAKAK